MIVVGRNQNEKDRAELVTLLRRHGITDVVLMLADIYQQSETPRGKQLHDILIEAREKMLVNNRDRRRTT